MALTVTIHYDEIGLKGKNRPFFEKRLCENVRTALRELEAFKDPEGPSNVRVRPGYGRIMLRLEKEEAWEEAARVLGRVFGVAHFGRVRDIPADMEEITATALEILPRDPDLTFAVKARRVDKNFPLRSIEICRRLGSAIETDRKWKVDLNNPQVVCYVTIMGKRALISGEKIKGPGGLPLGVSGKVVCLISGGIDSPVAAWRIMRRGALPVFVHFHSYPFTEKSGQEAARRAVEILLRGQARRPLWFVPLGRIQEEIIGSCAEDLRVLLYRRFMLRLAERVARREKARALVTGEALGQVASQTLENLAALEACVGLPVLRPLIGFDKQEIVQAARDLGTFQARGASADDCCSYLLPRHPATAAAAERLQEEEAALAVEELLEDALARSERIVVRGAP